MKEFFSICFSHHRTILTKVKNIEERIFYIKRCAVLTGLIRDEAITLLNETMAELQMSPLAMEVMPDHIHILADCKPQLRLSDAIKVLKGNTARRLFLDHPELKQSLWGGHLWNPSYFVVTVSDRSLEQVTNYINEQTRKPEH